MTDRITWLVFLFSAGTILYVYRGYLWLLRLLAWWKRIAATSGSAPFDRTTAGAGGAAQVPYERWPRVTIYMPLYNEEDRVARRLKNLLDQDYPPERVQILVVSDGSTDGTAAVVRRIMEEHPERDIDLIEFERKRGRAAAQNLVAREARHDILVSTDADSIFVPEFLERVVAPLLDPQVGVASGTLVYRDPNTQISDAIRTYWDYEIAIRSLESELGVFAQPSGPCLAYRRQLWRPIEAFEDVDRVVVFFARSKGWKAVHVPDAICFDTPNHHWRQEVRVRRRMTRKGMLTVLHRWSVRDALKDPFFTTALWSHKVARFVTPVYTVGFVVSGGLLLFRAFGIVPVLSLAAVLSTGVALGYVARWGVVRALVGKVKSFSLANVGFALGLWDVLRGDREGRYRPTRKLAPSTSGASAERCERTRDRST